MGVYLEKLTSVLNDVQARQITSLLVKKKNTGEVHNLEEFRAYLNTLTDKVLSAQVVPTLQIFLGQFNQVIDSESYNFMLDRIKDDLEAAYAEIDNLDELIDRHTDIINNVVLNALKLGVEELETKVTAYEFLASNTHGLDSLQFNTFKGSQVLRTFRTDGDTALLFSDPRTGLNIPNDVTLDTVGERITLGSDNLHYVELKSIDQLFDFESPQSEDIVSLKTNDISNAIDGAKDTYWTYSILRNTISQTGIKTKLHIKFAATNEINFLEIEPASVFPMTLIDISYTDANSIVHTVPNITTDIINNSRIHFSSIVASSLILTFVQKNAAEVQYENKQINDNFSTSMVQNTADVNIENLVSILRDSIKSSKILEQAFMVSVDPVSGERVKYYDYEIGFDNIRAGFGSYANNSIFVSSELKIDHLSQIAIRSKELRPLEIEGQTMLTNLTYTNPDSGFFKSSIEYWAIIKNYNANDGLININTIPLLPISVSRIHHEALILREKVDADTPNLAKLMFYTRQYLIDNTTDYNIVVYKNGIELVYLTDWVVADYPYTNDIVPPTGIPNSIGIKILNPTLYDFYTVSYLPILSTSRANPAVLGNILLNNDLDTINIIDLVGDGSTRLGLYNIIYIDTQKQFNNISAYSKVNLVIILRNNSMDTSLSAAVDEYVLLTASANSNKLVGGFDGQ